MIGRALRQKMRDNAAETPARVAERVGRRKACEVAVAAMDAKYPTLTAENAAEAIVYQETVFQAELRKTGSL